jgi:hypothetical protein
MRVANRPTKASPLKRLEALEAIRARRRRTHFIWVNKGDSRADIEARQDRLIAQGTASPDDVFVRVGWKGSMPPRRSEG